MFFTGNRRPAERLYLHHFRRAGGTSLRSYCEQLAEEKGWQYDVIEGYTLDFERQFESAPPTLHITCLRDPIARIKSSYRFEGRWGQQDRDPRPETEKSFADWAEERRCNDGQPFLWMCTENYYVKSLIGYPTIGADGIGREELDLAKQRLRKFELVLITDRLSDPETADYLRQRLDFDVPVPHRRYREHERPAATDSELFDAPTLTWLGEANQLDIELFREAERLFRRRVRMQNSRWIPRALRTWISRQA